MTIPEGSAFAQMIGSSGYYHTGVGVHFVMILPDLKLVIVQRYDTDGTRVDPGDGAACAAGRLMRWGRT